MKPFWSIDLADDLIEAPLTFLVRRDQLNDHGVFEIPRPHARMPTMLTLFINDTARNNQTVIECAGDREDYRTTVFIYGMFADIIATHNYGHCHLISRTDTNHG